MDNNFHKDFYLFYNYETDFFSGLSGQKIQNGPGKK
jgi:hypothetical protein